MAWGPACLTIDKRRDEHRGDDADSPLVVAGHRAALAGRAGAAVTSVPGARPRLRIGRIFDWALGGAIASGILLTLLRAAFGIYRRDFTPFPTFGEEALGRAEQVLPIAFAALWLAWAISV